MTAKQIVSLYNDVLWYLSERETHWGDPGCATTSAVHITAAILTLGCVAVGDDEERPKKKGLRARRVKRAK